MYLAVRRDCPFVTRRHAMCESRADEFSASIAATTTGKYSGRHPAMTAFAVAIELF